MHPHAILSAIGPDRPGLVDEVTSYIFERGGNLEDSRMVNLRGQFAIMMLIAAASDTLERLRRDLSSLQQKTGLQAQLHIASAAPGQADALAYRLTATGIDQPGVVHRISHALRDLGINIESLDTRLTSAPYTGAPMFELDVVISVPRRTPVSALRKSLASLCDELNFDHQLAAL